MFKLDTAREVIIDKDLIMLLVAVGTLFAIYFFSFQIQKNLAKIFRFLSKKLGVYSTTNEYTLQRYVYQHSSSPIAKLYHWVNEQLIALGIKRLGVTVFGYLLFWGVVSIFAGLIMTFILQMGLAFFPFIFLMIFVITLVMTRVTVSERLEKREADIMNAIDLIVPEIKNGVKNAIVTYRDNFASSVKDDFIAFIINIQDRGYSFEDAMFILSDNLGGVFRDFAQKAVYFEAIGEPDMVDIFTDITETNRLRRELRDENSMAFTGLKTTFIISVLMVVGYFCFIVFTDDFSRWFFLQQTAGKFLLLVMVGIVFAVLSYITTIKSQVI